MRPVISVIHLVLVLGLIGVVLLQRAEGGGLGIGGGGGGGFMSSRGTTNLLARTTAILAAGFFLPSLFLSGLAGYERKPASILNPSTSPAPISQPGSAPQAPVGGLLDSLKKPEAPSAPQAPQSK